MFLPFHAAEGTITLDGIIRNDIEEIESACDDGLIYAHTVSLTRTACRRMVYAVGKRGYGPDGD